MTTTCLLYDGVCGLCNRFVRFVLRHDRRGSLLFAPLGGPFAQEAFVRFPELVGVNSVVLLSGARAWTRTAAVIEVLRYLGGTWRALAALLQVLPPGLRDWGYDLIARHRYGIFGRFDACPLPAPQVRARFLE